MFNLGGIQGLFLVVPDRVLEMERATERVVERVVERAEGLN